MAKHADLLCSELGGRRKRAHNPLLLSAGFAQTDVAVPWWGGRRLQLSFG